MPAPLQLRTALSPVLSVELLRPSPKLLLQRYVPRPLNRIHEPREILLLCFDYRDPLLLESQGCVEQVAHVLLVRFPCRSHLQAELASGFPLLRGDLRQLRGEAGARQVPGAQTAIAHGNGGVLSSQSTVILGTQATV